MTFSEDKTQVLNLNNDKTQVLNINNNETLVLPIGHNVVYNEPYKCIATCKTEEEFIMMEQALFALEFRYNPDMDPIYILYNNKKFWYNIQERFGKYYICSNLD